MTIDPAAQIPADAPPVACVDIGGTKVAVAIADGHGLRARVTEPTVKHGTRDALSQQVLRLIDASTQPSCSVVSVTSDSGRFFE